MSLKDSNPYLRKLTPVQRRKAVLVSVESSSAVEGIRAPFTSGKLLERPATKAEFIAFWRQRASATAR